MERSESSDEPKYQLAQGTFSSPAGSKTLTITGNHVRLGGTQYNNMWNLTNGTYGTAVHNNQPLWLTVPKNKTATLKISNITAGGGFTSGANVAMNFRKANSSTSGSFNTGNFKPAQNPDDIVVTKTLGGNEEEGCLFIYMGNTSSGYAEFDVEFWVGNERWI